MMPDIGLMTVVLLLAITGANALGLVVAAMQYRRTGIVFPAGILHVALVFYGAMPLTVILIGGAVAQAVFARYQLEKTNQIAGMYLASSLACMIVTMVSGKRLPDRERMVLVPQSSINTLYLLVIIGSISLFFIYDRTWAAAGGIIGFLFSGRGRLEMGDVVWSGFWAFFNYYVLFCIISAVYLMAYCSQRCTRGRIPMLGWIAGIGLTSFVVMNLVGGTRLIAFFAFILAAVAGLTYFRIRRLHLLILLTLVLGAAFNFVGAKRSEIRQMLAQGDLMPPTLFDDVISASLVPGEAFTGYIPGYIMFTADPAYFDEPQYIKPIPRFVAAILGIEKRPHMSALLGMRGTRRNNLTVFTVPLPVDAYVGLRQSYVLVFFYSLTLFALSNAIGIALIRRKSLVGVLGYLLVIGLMWVLIRYDINRSFSRVWQTVLFSVPLFAYFWLLDNRSKLDAHAEFERGHMISEASA